MFNSIRNKMSAWFGMAMGVLAQNAGVDNSLLTCNLVDTKERDNLLARFLRTYKQVQYVPSQKSERSSELVSALKQAAEAKRQRKRSKRYYNADWAAYKQPIEKVRDLQLPCVRGDHAAF